MPRPPLPPSTRETAKEKVCRAEDAWNGREPARAARAHSSDGRWRNPSTFLQERAAIDAFLAREGPFELDARPIKARWALRADGTACINDRPIAESERPHRRPAGRRPDDRAGPTLLGL